MTSGVDQLGEVGGHGREVGAQPALVWMVERRSSSTRGMSRVVAVADRARRPECRLHRYEGHVGGGVARVQPRLRPAGRAVAAFGPELSDAVRSSSGPLGSRGLRWRGSSSCLG